MAPLQQQPDLNESRIFTAVVNEGSLTAAAKWLAIPKSTVSRKLAALEQRLGVRLLQRTTRRIGLTTAGQSYYQRVQRLINELAEIEAEMRTTQEEAAGRLYLSVAYEFGLGFLTDLVKGFMAEFPKVALEVELSNRVVDLVGEGVDLAIRGGILDDSSLIARRLGPGIGVVCASPAYLAQYGHPEHPRQLQQHQCIFRAGTPRDTIWRFKDESGELRVPVGGRYGVSDRSLMKQGALKGLGVAILPAYMVVDEIRSGQLVELLKGYLLDTMGVYVVYPSRRQLSTAARAFIDYACETLNPPPWTKPEYLP